MYIHTKGQTNGHWTITVVTDQARLKCSILLLYNSVNTTLGFDWSLQISGASPGILAHVTSDPLFSCERDLDTRLSLFIYEHRLI